MRKRLARICDRYGIAELQIFDSRALGTPSPAATSTFSTQCAPGRRLGWEIEQLANEFTALFGHLVDMMSLRSLHPCCNHPS